MFDKEKVMEAGSFAGISSFSPCELSWPNSKIVYKADELSVYPKNVTKFPTEKAQPAEPKPLRRHNCIFPVNVLERLIIWEREENRITRLLFYKSQSSNAEMNQENDVQLKHYQYKLAIKRSENLPNSDNDSK